MDKLSARKRSVIVGDYLSGLSYSEIAARQHVSTGSVANVVADLKAGRFPEAGDIGEQIEQLKELSLDLKRVNLTPGRCAVGLMALARISECGLEPADIDRWPQILKSAGNDEEAQEFIRQVYAIQEVQNKTGLSLDALEDKVHELEKKAAELEPVSGNLVACKKQIVELTKQRRELASEVANLEEKRKVLNPQVKELEKMEKDLSHRVAELEPIVKKAEATLATLSKETQRLQNIGLTLEELAEFCQRVQVVARRYSIKPAELRGRLLHELETLDKGLGLEALKKAKQLELKEAKQAVTATEKELETTRAVVGSLKQEKTKLEASIKEIRERVSQEIAMIVPVARDTVDQLTKELRSGVDNALAEVGQLRFQSLQAGQEVGRYQEILSANAWLKELLVLVRGEQDIDAKRVRVIVLWVLRGTATWLTQHEANSMVFSTRSSALNNLIREWEQWKA